MKKGLIIIPARGGSKGIKNKNIINVCGKPLIYYTIKPSLRVKKEGLVDEVIVSTDSKKIADIAQKMGAAVPFLRPKRFSRDNSRSIELVLHAINFFEKKEIFYEYIVLLQPTSPLRKYKDLKQAIIFYVNKNRDSLISVYHERKIDITEIYQRKNNIGVALSHIHNKGIGRQKIDDIFIRNAAIYISSVNYIKKYKKIISGNPLLYEMSKNRSIDIDTNEDLKKLRKILCK